MRPGKAGNGKRKTEGGPKAGKRERRANRDGPEAGNRREGRIRLFRAKAIRTALPAPGRAPGRSASSGTPSAARLRITSSGLRTPRIARPSRVDHVNRNVGTHAAHQRRRRIDRQRRSDHHQDVGPGGKFRRTVEFGNRLAEEDDVRTQQRTVLGARSSKPCSTPSNGRMSDGSSVERSLVSSPCR